MKLFFKIVIVNFILAKCCFAQNKIAVSNFILKLMPVFNGKPLELRDKEYITDQNDTISIHLFKFYLSNLNLEASTKLNYPKRRNSYLIDVEDTITLTLKINEIPTSYYNGINFLIGVDSLTNISGALDGDLDPIKGMYWAWNTGYISAKLEGTFKNKNSSKNKFEFHIGGYQQPYTSSRAVSISFDEIKLQECDTLIVNCYVDLAVWFSGNETLPLNKLNTVVHPCKASYEMANKYAEMIKYQSNYIHK
jgi:hypothetical protein